MDHPSGKKLFTAEKQRMKTTGTAYVSAGSGADSDSVLAAIAALQGEVRALDQFVRAQAGEEAPEPPPPPPEPEHHHLGLASEEVKLLRNEIRAMSLAIHQTKSEIAALRPANSEDDRLMVVTQELDAIVSATEGATNTILEAAEKVDMLAEQIEQTGTDTATHQTASDIRDTIITMFEACNFQDITGQRISKVVKTLQFIEERVNKMIEIWGVEGFSDVEQTQEEIDEEAALLNGPQLANQGVTQADIDKLFD